MAIEDLLPKPQQIKAMFARIAQRYDLNNRLHSMWRDQAWRRAAAQAATVRPGMPALDVACGTGDLTILLWRAGARPVVGADFCPQMLQVARRKFPTQDIRWIECDAGTLPFPDGMFDAVTIAFGLRNIDDPRRAIGEFLRVLSSGGRLVVLEFTPSAGGAGARAIRWFQRHVMVRTAGAIAGGQGGAYDYLHQSIQSFWSADRLAQAMRDAGFTGVQSRPLTLGVAAVHCGTRP